MPVSGPVAANSSGDLDNHPNGLLRIQRIGNRPWVMRSVGSAVIEGMGDGRRSRDVYVGTGCLRSRRGYRDAG